jgi:hypothetical protein
VVEGGLTEDLSDEATLRRLIDALKQEKKVARTCRAIAALHLNYCKAREETEASLLAELQRRSDRITVLESKLEDERARLGLWNEEKDAQVIVQPSRRGLLLR